MVLVNTQGAPSLIMTWEEGVLEFNSGRYWHAHERWEVGWKGLKFPEKEHIQALIQVCGVFHLLIERSRVRPALSLAKSALKKLEKSETREFIQKVPRLEIQGVHRILKEIISKHPHGENLTPEKAKEYALELSARVLYSFGVEY